MDYTTGEHGRHESRPTESLVKACRPSLIMFTKITTAGGSPRLAAPTKINAPIIHISSNIQVNWNNRYGIRISLLRGSKMSHSEIKSTQC